MGRIGILVVYVFDDKMQELFDIHLERIRRHTASDFKIYAAGHKLPPAQFEHVDAAETVELFRPDVPKGSSIRDEHSFCLRDLADSAFSDGCDHVICLHLDSFPLQDRWEEAFVGPIQRGEAAVTSIIPNGYSAGLCWSRQFDREFAPPMLVSDEDRGSEAFDRFMKEFPEFDHVETGLGIIFAAFKNGLPWKRIGTDSERKVYGGLLFHLVGGTYRTSVDHTPIRNTGLAPYLWPLVRRAIRPLSPRRQRRMRELFINTDRMTREGTFASKRAETRALMSDPESYIEMQIKQYEGSSVAFD